MMANLAGPSRPPLRSTQASATRQPQPPPTAGKKEDAAPKPKAGKLSAQHRSPPKVIRRPLSHSSHRSGSATDFASLARGVLLGEGGFARVYEATDQQSGEGKAVKVISKDQLKSSKTKSKLFAEIKLHQSMDHPYIVRFETCFEDVDNVYMQLELCEHGSMLDLLRKRKRYTEPEARLLLVQLIAACSYMHSSSVIHRDLKLGNLLLGTELVSPHTGPSSSTLRRGPPSSRSLRDDDGSAEDGTQEEGLCVKVADFGLAALVRYKGERKKTICGTPNYIAPEILFDQANGHSFEVDVWSVGVILYTLLVGKPPFQTKDVKEIYKKIKENAYTFPTEPGSTISLEATSLISDILNKDPTLRPSLSTILSHPFFTSGPFPSAIPASALWEAPDFRHLTRRQSERNFLDARRRLGLIPSPSTASSSVDSVAALTRAASTLALIDEREENATAEEDQPAPPVRKQREAGRIVGVGIPLDPHRAAKEQRRVEREAQHAVSPASPIAELLRSARKPLYVSPRQSAASPANNTGAAAGGTARVPQPQFAASGTGGSSAEDAEAKRGPGLGSSTRAERRADRVPARIKGETDQGRQKARIASGMIEQSDHLGRSDGDAPVKDVFSSAAGEGKENRKAGGATAGAAKKRDLYEASYRTLDDALEATSAAELARLPRGKAVAPKVFISSWVDYTHKYGTAYALTDGSSGLHFNDSTTMVLAPDSNHFDYISNLRGSVYQRRNHTLNPMTYPPDLGRKTYLLQYFQEYMAKTLQRDVGWTFVDEGRTNHLDYLVKTYRMKKAIVFKLSNDVIQINFWDHQKLLLTDSARTVTFIEPDLSLHVHSIGSLFAEASSLGLFSAASSSSQPGEGNEAERTRRDEVANMLSKLEYARDTLRSLANRAQKAATAAAATAHADA